MEVKINKKYLTLLFLFSIFIFSFIGIIKFLKIVFVEYLERFLTIVFLVFLVYSIPKILNIENKKISNSIFILGFLIITIYSIFLIIREPSISVAGGTIIGLVLGLALQPVLSNLFAGFLILFTGYLKIGDKVRILTPQIPYQAAFLPAYKYFSYTEIPIGYKGFVEEVGIISTRIVLVTGVRIKVPNSIILNSGVVELENTQEYRLIKVMFEFPIKKIRDPEKFLEDLKNRIKKVKDIKNVVVNYSEQSDKDNVIIEIKFEGKTKDWKSVKSNVIKELIKIKNKSK